MAKQPKHAISPLRSENYPEWFQQVIKESDLAEHSVVRGCMVIKPWGYAIWENMQRELDDQFKATGHMNAYFPLFIPLSHLEKEAEHVEGFAKECAVVTHHRLVPDGKGKLKPASPLDEPLVVRPTSETIIGESYAKWVQSYRDLPILINQWANVVRWEMRTRLFLRTTEFLWQEGHTVHATKEEAVQETLQMLDVYADFAKNHMAMPVVKGEKTADERFPGAVSTYTIEALMQDGKALQAGTSHFLGQNFAKAAGIKFIDRNETEQIAWTTSWGVSTRLIGGLIMTHSDDDGLILPPRLAPKHIAIIPIYRNDEERAQVLEYCDKLRTELQSMYFHNRKILVELDDRDLSNGVRTWHHIKRGVPIRLQIGPRDIANDSVFMGRRDQPTQEKNGISRTEFIGTVTNILEEMQSNLLARAEKYRTENTKEVTTFKEFEEHFTEKNSSGYVLCPAIDTPEWTDKIKPFKVTARCIPLEQDAPKSPCIFTGKETKTNILFAKSY